MFWCLTKISQVGTSVHPPSENTLCDVIIRYMHNNSTEIDFPEHHIFIEEQLTRGERFGNCKAKILPSAIGCIYKLNQNECELTTRSVLINKRIVFQCYMYEINESPHRTN